MLLRTWEDSAYVCMYVCMYVCFVLYVLYIPYVVMCSALYVQLKCMYYIHTHMYAYSPYLRIYVCLSILLCMHIAHIYVCMYVYVYIPIIHTPTCIIIASAYVCMYVCMLCANVCTYAL